MPRKKLSPATARRLSEALDGIEGARQWLAATRTSGDEEALVDAADRYLGAREEMGETMKLVGDELEGS